MTAPLTIKPLMRRSRLGYEWVCYDKGFQAFGWGTDMEAAYELWLRRFRLAEERR